MPFEVRCPNPLCGKVYRVREELAGRLARCHWCGKSFRIPRPEIGQQLQEAQVPLREQREEIGSRGRAATAERAATARDLIPRRAGLAIAAAGFGIVGLLSSVFIVGMIPAIFAVVLGLLGRKKARENPEQFAGMGIAKAGVAFGAAAIAISVLSIPIWTGIVRGARSRMELERINLAIENYRRDQDGDIPRLADLQNYTSSRGQQQQRAQQLQRGQQLQGEMLAPSRRELRLEDFIYLKPGSDSPGDKIVLYAKKRYFLLGRAVLRNNGESDFISERELSEALDREVSNYRDVSSYRGEKGPGAVRGQQLHEGEE